MPRPKSLKSRASSKQGQELGSVDLEPVVPSVQGSRVPSKAKKKKGVKSPQQVGSKVSTVKGSRNPSQLGSGVPIFYNGMGSVVPNSTDNPSRAIATHPPARDPAQELALKRRLILKALAEASFYEYVKQAWRVIETVPFKDGRHIRVICGLLQQISEGKLKDVVLNMPPRHMKSLLVSVLWPTWEWIKRPEEKFLCVSYDKALAEELGTKARKVIQSEWYQLNWGHVYQLSTDQNAKHSYTNDKNGARISIQMGGNITGKGGSRLILDDPNDPSAKPAERAEALAFFSEKLQSRLNDPNNPSLIVQQRTAEDDITGFVLENKRPEHPFTHVCLPAKYEKDSPSPYDWRTEEGQPLWPELYPVEALDRLQRFMDPSTIAGQYQQRPQSKTGGSFDVSQMETVDSIPAGSAYLRAWDFAGTDGAGDWTVGVLLAIAPDGVTYFCDVVREQLRSDDVEQLVKATFEMDGPSVPVCIPQDPGQAGLSQVRHYQLLVIPEADLRVRKPTGAKEVRWAPLAAQMRAGLVKMLKGEWNKELVKELHLCPKGKWDDQADAGSDAYNEIVANGGGALPITDPKRLLNLPRRVATMGRIIDSEEPQRKGPLYLLPKRRG